MPRFPQWEQQVAFWTDAVQLRQAQLNQVVGDLAARGREVTGTIPATVSGLAGRARARFEQLPVTMVEEFRRRVNLMDLATRYDVEAQSRLGRNRISFVLQEFLDGQRIHDEALVESLRAELREELASFAAAVDDNLLVIGGAPTAPDARPSRRAGADLDYLLDDVDDDDDDLDLVGYDDTLAAED